MTISGLPEFFASITFRQMAAGAFSRPPSRVPHGPVDVVEAGEVRFQIDDSRTWYWRNACQSRRLSWAK